MKKMQNEIERMWIWKEIQFQGCRLWGVNEFFVFQMKFRVMKKFWEGEHLFFEYHFQWIFFRVDDHLVVDADDDDDVDDADDDVLSHYRNKTVWKKRMKQLTILYIVYFFILIITTFFASMFFAFCWLLVWLKIFQRNLKRNIKKWQPIWRKYERKKMTYFNGRGGDFLKVRSLLMESWRRGVSIWGKRTRRWSRTFWREKRFRFIGSSLLSKKKRKRMNTNTKEGEKCIVWYCDSVW